MISDALFSSACTDWGAPQKLFDGLDREFHFTLDPCANETNHKCARYFTERENGLLQDWGHETVFCNPPYGRHIEHWVAKCYEHAGIAVMLIPGRLVSNRSRWAAMGHDERGNFPALVVQYGSTRRSVHNPPGFLLRQI